MRTYKLKELLKKLFIVYIRQYNILASLQFKYDIYL